MIPSIIVEGKGNPYFNRKRITFISYSMVYNRTTTDLKEGAYQPSHLTNQMIMEVLIS